MKKKILIVDDSALIRRTISDIIVSDSRLKVEALATNGIEALDLIVAAPHRFDVVLLDLNMPKMDGLEFLEQLNKLKIKVVTIVVSTLATEGAQETIRALELGAFDFVTKPGGFMEAKSENFRDKLISCISIALGLGDEKDAKNEHPKEETKKEVKKETVIKAKERPSGKVVKGSKLVAIACSTGGPKALQSVIPLLPKNLDAPVMLVQHMPEGFTKSLAERLNDLSHVKVKEAEDGDVLEKGTVYIAKGGFQMRLNVQPNGQNRITLTKEPARGGLRPCADIMYESLISSEYEQIICVVLTGMGGDGTHGIKQLKEHKNIYVISQDAATCTVYGMPKVVAEAGLSDEVEPLTSVAGAIAKNVGVR